MSAISMIKLFWTQGRELSPSTKCGGSRAAMSVRPGFELLEDRELLSVALSGGEAFHRADLVHDRVEASQNFADVTAASPSVTAAVDVESNAVTSPAAADYVQLGQNTADLPYILDQEGATYVLTEDISAPREAIVIATRNVTLDLAGYTITYDQVGGGVPNPGFEDAGSAQDQPAGWDLSGAPGARRVSTFANPVEGRWSLTIPEAGQDQTIVSGWADLPPLADAMAYFIRDDTWWRYRLPIRLEVEHETLGVIAAFEDTKESRLFFTTPETDGRYRVRLTRVQVDRPVWQPETEYAIGDAVIPSEANGAWYMLNKVGDQSKGASSDVEPEWNTPLGSVTEDGALRWTATHVGTSSTNSAWQPGKEYSLNARVRPTTPNGRVYTLTRIHVPGSVSGTEEPNWTVPPSNVATRDGDQSWNVYRFTDANVDLVDVRPEGTRGIRVNFSRYRGEPTNVTIKNGTIRQGAGGGFRSHAVYVNGKHNFSIEDLSITTNGLESAGIYVAYSSGSSIQRNTVTTTGVHKFNRYQASAAVSVFHSNDMLIADNDIMSGKSWGGIYAVGERLTVENNRVHTESVTVNHYGIGVAGEDNLVRANTITADPGQGLALGGARNVAEENDITIYSVAPNWAIGRYSLDGIRVNDYYSGRNRDQVIRNNRITLYGQNSPYYERREQYLNGIANVSNGPGNLFEGNVIQAIRVDPEVVVSGIMPGSKDELVVWRNNTITSDQYSVLFGHYPKHSLNTRFENNRFVKGENATDDYAVLAATPKISEYVRNTVFYDTILEGGGTIRSIAVPRLVNANPQYSITWTLDVRVQVAGGNPIEGATVRIVDGRGDPVYEGLTGPVGEIESLELPESDIYFESREWQSDEYGPYTITAGFLGSTETEIVALDSSTTVEIVFADTDFDSIDSFVLGLTNPAAYQAVFGVPPLLNGDFDMDGDQDFDDIAGFVAILRNGVAASLRNNVTASNYPVNAEVVFSSEDMSSSARKIHRTSHNSGQSATEKGFAAIWSPDWNRLRQDDWERLE